LRWRCIRFGLEWKARYLFRVLLHRQGGAQERNHISGIYRQIQLLELIFITEVGRITAIIDGDISKLTSALSLARSQATNAVAGIETGMKGGLKNGLAGINWNGLGMDTATDYLRGITAGMGPIGTALEGVATALGPTGLVAVAAVAGGAIIAKAAFDAAAAWEAGMAQISKTTGIELGSSGFNDLSEDLKDLYATMPTTMSEIQNVAKSAGSLGIEESSIAGYTRVALEMGSAFDIPAEEAAVAVGKVQSQLKKLPEGVEDSAQFARNFGSAVDYAGNSMNATEAEVLDFSTRTAGSLSLLGGSAYELAGWGGATASVFSSSQLAAGSFNAALTQLTGTTKGSQEAQAKAAEMLGVTTDEFSQMMATDPTDTVLRLGNALEELDPAEATKAAGILGGGYGDDFFKKMVGHTDEWRGKIDEVVAAGEKGESIGKSFEAGSEGAKAALQELKNSISTILIDIGGPILTALTPVLSGLATGLNKIREIGENLWGPLTTVLSPLTTGAGILAGHIGTMAGMSLDALVLASQAISKAFELGGKYAEAVKAEILEIIENSGPFKAVSGFVDDISDAFQRLYDKIAEVVSKIADGLTNAIPTAISGTAGALGTLAEKAGLGGVADAAGGVFDFFGDVNARVWGEEVGKEAADGIKGSGLATAPGEALNSDEAKREAEKAAQELAKSYSKELYDTVQGFGGISDLDALAILNEQSSSPKKKDNSIGAVNIGGVQIDSTLDAANRNAWVVLKTEGGQEIDRRSIRGGEWNGDTAGAIRDMMQAHPETFGGLSDLEQAELSGEKELAETLKIQAGAVEVETTTEARLKELSSIDLATMKANITEIESEISGLSRGLRDIDEAFADIAIEPVVMTVELNTSAAYTQWGHLVQDMENLTIRLPVELDIKVYTPEIRAIVDAAIVESLA
jgi:TP901 family phage tail tape measure protein